MSKTKLSPSFLVPITTDGNIPDLRDIAGIILRNAGSNTVEIENGRWTLDSKETISINVTEPNATMDFFNISVAFVGVGTNNLQIIALYPSNC